ncbi:hypothetical protein [Streptomyces olivaceiscleroticus]|uniref:Uncharacterized protein n=1 Tax=Streptomyces olivaceiscleroticus TaxID=68245 RepID=A0ABN0ZWM8_9ACTN
MRRGQPHFASRITGAHGLCRRKFAGAAVGAVAVALTLGSNPAMAGGRVSSVANAHVGGAQTAYPGQVEMDRTGEPKCSKKAWIIGHAKWSPSKVSRKSVEVKSITVSYRSAVGSEGNAQFLQRGNYKTVWQTRWVGPVLGVRERSHSVAPAHGR